MVWKAAFKHGDRETSLPRLGKLHRDIGNIEEAAKCAVLQGSLGRGREIPHQFSSLTENTAGCTADRRADPLCHAFTFFTWTVVASMCFVRVQLHSVHDLPFSCVLPASSFLSSWAAIRRKRFFISRLSRPYCYHHSLNLKGTHSSCYNGCVFHVLMVRL